MSRLQGPHTGSDRLSFGSRQERKFVSLETKDSDQWPYPDTAASHLLEPGGLPQEECE